MAMLATPCRGAKDAGRIKAKKKKKKQNRVILNIKMT